MMLMKTRKHSISGLQNDSTFYSWGLDIMVLMVSDSSVFLASLFSLQLNWRLAPEELGLCRVVCISPLLKRDDCIVSWAEFCFKGEEKRGAVVLLIREHSMMHGTLLTMGLGVPFSFFQKKGFSAVNHLFTDSFWRFIELCDHFVSVH